MRGWATTSRKRIFSSSFGIGEMRVLAPGEAAERRPGLHRHLAVGLGREGEDHLGGVDVAVDPGQALGGALLGDDAVEALQEVDLVLGVPGHALAAVAELGHERPERREALVEVGVVALDHGDRRHGLAGDRLALAALPVLHVERLGDLGRRVVHDRGEHHILLDAQHLRRDFGELLGDGLVDLPVAARFPHRVHRAGQRVDEGVHVGGVEVVLLVPGGGGQHDVGVDAGRRHAEVERHQQVELSFRRLVVPDDIARLLRAHLAQLLAHHAMRGAEQVLEEILVALAGGAQQVGAPHEHVARPVLRVVGVMAGELELAGLERPRRRSPSASLPAAAACFATSSGLVSSCGAEGSQPMRSARTL